MQGFRSHASGESGIRIRNVLNPPSSVEICEYAMNSKSCIRWRNKIKPSSLQWILYSRWQPRCQVLSLTCRGVNLSLLFAKLFWGDSDALYNACLALLAIFPEQSWVLEWFRMRVGYSPERANLIWIRIFSLRISKVFGFKNIMRFLFLSSVVQDNVEDTRSRVFAIIFSIVEWWKVIRTMM